MKSDNVIYFDIVNSVKTLAERDKLSSEIDYILEALFETSKNSLDTAFKKISIDTEERLKETFKKNNIDILDKETVKNFLEKLKKSLTNFKIIKLTIAFDPSHQIIETISNWISKNLGEGYILDIDTDKSILGGAVVVFEGKYKDMP